MKKIHASLCAFVVAGLAVGLSGCAVEPKEPPRADVFLDAAFHPPSVAIDAREALALSTRLRFVCTCRAASRTSAMPRSPRAAPASSAVASDGCHSRAARKSPARAAGTADR